MIALLKHVDRLQCTSFCLLVSFCKLASPVLAGTAAGFQAGRHVFKFASCMCRNAEIEAQIAHLRAELLHKEQENDRVQLQLTQEKEERERAQRKVIIFSSAVSVLTMAQSGLHCIVVSYDAS